MVISRCTVFFLFFLWFRFVFSFENRCSHTFLFASWVQSNNTKAYHGAYMKYTCNQQYNKEGDINWFTAFLFVDGSIGKISPEKQQQQKQWVTT